MGKFFVSNIVRCPQECQRKEEYKRLISERGSFAIACLTNLNLFLATRDQLLVTFLSFPCEL